MNPIKFQRMVKECVDEVLNEAGRNVCAWCGKDNGAIEQPLSAGAPLMADSHGICKTCKDQVITALRAGKLDYVPELPPRQGEEPPPELPPPDSDPEPVIA
jgi:hypothetical protein